MKPLGKKSVNAGRSILEILWEELDSIMDRLMEDGEPADVGDLGFVEDVDWRQFGEDWKSYGEERGQAQGVAYCIAVMTNPYEVDVPAIKQAAVERWNDRQEDPIESQRKSDEKTLGADVPKENG